MFKYLRAFIKVDLVSQVLFNLLFTRALQCLAFPGLDFKKLTNAWIGYCWRIGKRGSCRGSSGGCIFTSTQALSCKKVRK